MNMNIGLLISQFSEQLNLQNELAASLFVASLSGEAIFKTSAFIEFSELCDAQLHSVESALAALSVANEQRAEQYIKDYCICYEEQKAYFDVLIPTISEQVGFDLSILLPELAEGLGNYILSEEPQLPTQFDLEEERVSIAEADAFLAALEAEGFFRDDREEIQDDWQQFSVTASPKVGSYTLSTTSLFFGSSSDASVDSDPKPLNIYINK